MALVIRRGPSKWWHFMLWNRDNGEITPGSWFNGMIYPYRCDLSPKGDWCVILAMKGGNDPPAWSALCRPPCVSAEQFWPQQTCTYGGGFFDERLPVLWMNIPVQKSEGCDKRSDHGLDFGYQDGNSAHYGSVAERLARNGWKLQKTASCNGTPPPLRWIKKCRPAKAELILQVAGTAEELEENPSLLDSGHALYFVKDGNEERPLDGATWADWNSKGELCLCQDGCLFTANASGQSRRLVVDLRNLSPRERVNARSGANWQGALHL